VRISGVTSAFAVIHTKTLLQPCSACGARRFIVFPVCSYHATGMERKRRRAAPDRPPIHPHLSPAGRTAAIPLATLQFPSTARRQFTSSTGRRKMRRVRRLPLASAGFAVTAATSQRRKASIFQ
jgi:hypothetical protein